MEGGSYWIIGNCIHIYIYYYRCQKVTVTVCDKNSQTIKEPKTLPQENHYATFKDLIEAVCSSGALEG